MIKYLPKKDLRTQNQYMNHASGVGSILEMNIVFLSSDHLRESGGKTSKASHTLLCVWLLVTVYPLACPLTAKMCD
jgi:hypothetical protein